MKILKLTGLTGLFTNKKLIVNIGFVLVGIVASIHFSQLRLSLSSFYAAGSPRALVEGIAKTPFQYRVFVPWIVRGLDDFQSAIPMTSIYQFIDILSVFFLLVAFRQYLAIFFKNHILLAVLPFSLFYILPWLFIFPRYLPIWYPWDMPSILFTTLGLMFIYKRQWAPFYILFVIATFNRETTCFLTIIYLLTAIGNTRLKIIVGHCASQLAIWVGIKLLLHWLYAGNEGFLYENHLPGNLNFIMKISNYPFLLSVFGFLWIPVIMFFNKIPDPFVKRSVMVVFPFFISMFLVGNVNEFRIYGELVPVVLTPFLLILRELFKIESKETVNIPGGLSGAIKGNLPGG